MKVRPLQHIEKNKRVLFLAILAKVYLMIYRDRKELNRPIPQLNRELILVKRVRGIRFSKATTRK